MEAMRTDTINKNQKAKVKVWGLFVRIFHWLLVVLFFMEFLVDHDSNELHSFLGYSILLLLALRILYGFTSSQYARFSNFIYSPRVALNYIVSVFNFSAKRYIGHNPAGGMMIVVMIVLLVATVISGVLSLPYGERTGVLSIINIFPTWLLAVAEETHELLTKLSLFLVAIHVTGVLIESILHQENLIGSMITGRKNR